MQDRRQIKNRVNTRTKHNPEKQTAQNTAKQNYPCLVATRHLSLGQETRLVYSTMFPNLNGASTALQTHSTVIWTAITDLGLTTD